MSRSRRSRPGMEFVTTEDRIQKNKRRSALNWNNSVLIEIAYTEALEAFVNDQVHRLGRTKREARAEFMRLLARD